jgi:exopolyphosphatase/guanosine-5'-triphosphate,3'-diphosphate pyrophosphatase
VKIAAIDIGSNAIRLLIEEVREHQGQWRIDKVSLTRVPVRLGDEVFVHKKISDEKLRQLVKTMRAFWYLMDVHQVEMFRVCGTSAMREAKNKNKVIETVEREANFKIEVLSGEEEAELIFKNYFTQNLSNKGNYLYLDVGGGSTEITLIRKGKRIKGQSFNIGTVRSLTGATDESVWVDIKKYLSTLTKNPTKLIAIGTGGNVNTLFKIQGKKPNELLSLSELKGLQKALAPLTVDERIFNYKLRPDRADVILPACDIYIKILQLANIKEMLVPKIGLSDGIILDMISQIKKV